MALPLLRRRTGRLARRGRPTPGAKAPPPAWSLLAAIIESSDDAIITKDLDSIVTSWNPAAERMFGYKAEEVVGKPITILFPPERLQEEEHIVSRIRRGERVDHFETQRLRADGKVLDVSVTISPVRDEDGTIIGASKIVRDISDRRAAERVHRLLAAVVGSSADAVLTKTLDGRITSWNEAAERLFGYTSAEAVGMPVLNLIPPERHHEEVRILEELRHGRRVEAFDTQRLHKDGTLVDVSVTISPVRADGGEVIGASSVLRDIRRRKQAQEEARQARLLLERAEAIAGYGSCQWDPRENLVRPSPGLRSMLRLPAERTCLRLDDLLGIVDPQDREAVDRFLHGPPASGQRLAYRVQVGGETRWHEATAQVEPRVDGGMRVVLLVQDRTQERQLEQAREQASRQQWEIQRLRDMNDFKTRFLNIAAHELATPLTPMRIQVELLEGQQDPEKRQRSLELLRRNFERLSRVIMDVLEAARIQAERLVLRRRPASLPAILADTVEAFELQALENGVLLTSDCASTTPVEVDPDRIGQVLYNLLNNAVKFTPRGGRVVVSCHEEPGGVRVAVRDTGLGLTQEQIERLFQPFAQVHEHAEVTRVGSGLGLYISRGIVNAHGGRIWAESDGPGKGTTMQFVLPYKAPPKAAGAA